MSPFLAVFLVLVLGSTSYAAGRLHGQLSYRIGYRFGYRQGYFDGDRGAWNRRRREAQAAIASALAGPPPARDRDGRAARQGTTYTGSSFAAPSRGGTVAVAAPVAAPVAVPATASGRHPTGALVRWQG
ncbi:hypothetical protein C5N14_24615 [Micromonospora sp. MW-13]|uniref:hypothetical protein n=1 Tax=Micromonospora sp. MW-13 TaxID=2094022 RepID=UPI000E44FBAC|nr:hypothetical protein [Micromonospora sp. MW-13]RGC66304.1 hypothetical protein C5N14_24615 [Micromonospora sp. MW-13]